MQAANAYLDELLGGEVVQWGGWGEVGMAVDFSIMPLPGERFLPLSIGLDLLGKVLDKPRGLPVIALDCDWSKYSQNRSVFAQEETPLYWSFLVDEASAARHGSSTPALGGEPAPSGEFATSLCPGGATRSGVEALVGSLATSGPVHTFSLTLGAHTGPWALLRQHVVGGVAVAPATAYLSWVISALSELRQGSEEGGPTVVTLTDCKFTRMLQLTTPRLTTLELSPISVAPAAERGFATVRCDGSVHASMEYRVSSGPSKLLAGEQLQPRRTSGDIADSVEVNKPYEAMLAQGYSYGPGFALMQRLVVGRSSAFAEFTTRVPSSIAPCCPGELDAALQGASFLDAYVGTGTPIAIDVLEWVVGASISASVTTEDVDGNGSRGGDGGASVALLDHEQDVVGVVWGLRMALAAPPLTRLAFSSPSLTEAAAAPISTSTDLKDPPYDMEAARAAGGEAHEATTSLRVLRERMRCAPTVVCVGSASDPQRSGIASDQAAGMASDMAAAAAYDANASVVSSSGTPLIYTMTSIPQPTSDGNMLLADEPFIVHTDPGVGRVFFETAQRRRVLGETEVELLTSHWALNFRDVLVAKGAISSVVAGKSLGIGGECCGIVSRVGASVANFVPGDAVVAFPPDGMGSYLTTDARWVFPSPPLLDAVAAVSGTMVYATAWFALHVQARIRPGLDVLIHSAAGGVGLAAVALCLRSGCRVFATGAPPPSLPRRTPCSADTSFSLTTLACF